METSLRTLLACLALLGCDPGGSEGADGRPVETSLDARSADSGPADALPPDAAADAEPACEPAASFESGRPAFIEATEAWGLTGRLGVRLSALDYDGDGYPDVLLRLGGGPEDFGPEGERGRWLLRNTGSGFEDVTEASGLFTGRDGVPGGLRGSVMVSGDVDSDGDPDVYIATSNPRGDLLGPSSELMLNQGDGTFAPGPLRSAAHFAGEPSVPAGAAFLDFDLDGHLDLWVTHNLDPPAGPLPDRLLKGDGRGGFVDHSEAAGVQTSPWNQLGIAELNAGLGHSWAWSAAACDLNDDGLPDLLASSYGRAPNLLWRAERAEGEVVFVNEAVASGYAYDHREDWTDNFSARCHCRDRPEDPECERITEAPQGDCAQLRAAFGGRYRWSHASDREPWRLGGNSGATLCADLDNDGDLDLLTSEIVHWDVGQSSDPTEILVNTGVPAIRYERPGPEALGLLRVDATPSWDHGDITGAVLDFDNDGWQDVYVGATDYGDNHGLLFRQIAPLRFELLDTGDYFRHDRSHGVVAADFDRDGDLDLLVGHSTHRCEGAWAADCDPVPQVRLYLNVLGQSAHWLQLRLEGGAGSNAQAIGARVRVTAGETTQTQEIGGGHGHFGAQRDSTLHFGLGGGCEAEVEVRWPDAAGTIERFSLRADAPYHLRQGASPTRF